MSRALLFVAALTLPGCVRYLGGGDETNQGQTDAADAAAADGAGACKEPVFHQPQVVSRASLPGHDDWAPDLSADELVLVFASWRPGSVGGSDLWTAIRPDAQSPFSTPTNLGELNSAHFDSEPSLSANGLMICFHSDRPASTKHTNLYIATRPDRASKFGAPRALAELNTDGWDGGCDLSDAGLTLHFHGERGGSKHDLWTATRPDTASAFSAPVLVQGPNTQHSEEHPSLSSDGLEIYFSSDRPGGQGDYDVYVAQRATLSAPFGSAINLTALNTPNDDGNPSISFDGRRLYLNRDSFFSGGKKAADLWRADRRCEQSADSP